MKNKPESCEPLEKPLDQSQVILWHIPASNT